MAPAGEDPLVDVAIDEGTTVLTTVVEAVAEASGASVADMPPLLDVVDTDALGAVFSGTDRGRVVFPYAGFVVCVTADDRVVVHAADGAAWPE